MRKVKENKVFRDMAEVQKHFFPKLVGKICPYCNKPYDDTECIKYLREKNDYEEV